MQLKTRKLDRYGLDKFRDLILLFSDVFEMRHFVLPEHDHLQQLLERNDFFVFVAVEDNRVIGGLTAYKLMQYYSQRPLVYIYDIAIDPVFQRNGLGKLLITALKEYCLGQGIEEVFVQAGLEDDHAIDFYRSTGAAEEAVIHFSYPLHHKPL